MSGQGTRDLPGELREIAQMDHAACTEALAARPGFTLPSRLRVQTLRRILAYEIQVRALGRLSPKEQRALKAIAGGKCTSEATSQVAYLGTHLVREWNGRTYRVSIGIQFLPLIGVQN